MKMIIFILITLTAIMLINRIMKIVSTNMKETKGMDTTIRRRLLWRYGPFKIDGYVIEQHMYISAQEYSESGKYRNSREG
jgi:hypothetical protein